MSVSTTKHLFLYHFIVYYFYLRDFARYFARKNTRDWAWANTGDRTRVKAKRTKLVYLLTKSIIELTLPFSLFFLGFVAVRVEKVEGTIPDSMQEVSRKSQ